MLSHKKIYPPNLLFWIVTGFGIARFGQRGLKTPKLEHFGLKVCPPAAPLEVLRHPLRSHVAASRGARCITPQCLRSLWDNPFNTLFLVFKKKSDVKRALVITFTRFAFLLFSLFLFIPRPQKQNQPRPHPCAFEPFRSPSWCK